MISKVHLDSKETNEQGVTLKFTPVYTGASRQLFTSACQEISIPVEEIVLHTTNWNATEIFVPGKEYYVSFTPSNGKL